MSMNTRQHRLGFLYPGYSAADDIPAWCAHLSPAADCLMAHTPVDEDAHRVDALLELGQPERLLPCGEQLCARQAEVIIWACTSGSFVFGYEDARRQVDTLAEQLQRPVSSTSLAFEAALQALGVRRVAIAATYPHDVALRFVDFLKAGGVDVMSLTDADIMTADAVGELSNQDALAMARAGDHPQADAVLIPDTALHTREIVAPLENELGKPVLTANQVSVWQALRLAGDTHPLGQSDS